MSSFFRKRQASQAGATAPPSNVIIAQPASAALAHTRENAERPNPAVAGGQYRDRDQPSNASAPAQAPVQGPSAPTANNPPRPTFPWSTRRIALPPPLLLPRPGVPPVTAPSPSPFPRYGHSIPLTASQSGELFIFGGLVRESVRNDLYSFATRDLSATLVQTTGEIPPARVGHASALVSSVLIVWGGDTKQQDTDKQDEGLYLLNLGTREWTRVATRGPAPAGRYGHSVAMVGSRFFVFGGQVDGEFLNDLWSFDLNTLKSAPLWELVRPAQGNEPPPRRTGHVMLALDDTIYIFGGTDGSYHYNDTWAFDVNTRIWQELTCIGYIPVPREGHAAALVDDVMYVFGGRGVDGKDLNDLAAFKITTLSKANKAGFSWNDIPVDDGDDIKGSEPETNEAKKLLDLAFKLKQERASLQASVADQARIATERIAEVERMRAGAIQEAAFWRAKVAAYESGKTNEVVRMETERAAELEKQVSRALSDRAEAEKKVAELNESLATEMRLREQVEDRVSDLTQRAQHAEDALQRASSEHNELLEKHATASSELRSTTEKLFTLQSSQQTRDVETSPNLELAELRASRDRHLRALDQTQLALKAASARTDEVEEQWKRSNDQLQHLQMEYAELGRELEAKTAEVDSIKAQLLDVENKFTKSREEADALRALTTGSLGELLDYHRDLQADEERVGRAQTEKIRAFQAEAESLRDMLQSANDRHEEAQAELSRERKRARTIETDQLALRSQVSGIRSQLSTALTDLARARKDIAEKEDEVRESSRKVMDVELRFKMFRNYLSENGVVVDEEELANSTNGSKMYELETKLAERNREQEILIRQLRDAQEQSQTAEHKVSTLQAELGRAREHGGTADGDGRVVEAERRLAEAQSAHNERLQILEQDYRTAVQCVKGTEKMLKKMKEELSKQKGLNASLQAELEGFRSGSEGGSRVRPPNGRATPLSDEGQETGLRPQLIESQRQTQRLAAENADLHRRLEQLQGDVGRLRSGLDNMQHESDERMNRIEQLEDENTHLEESLNAARGGKSDSVAEQLHRDNMALRRENDQLSQRIELLLDVKRHPDSQSPNLRASDASMDANMNVDSMSSQLDDWQRRYNANSANRPVSDYDERR
ncbi:Negative regulator of mitotic exit [Serendipita sp. 405]|nr:Negative regulator of mitotic exit [Serendipita sp. 397]KAG8870214.1 Negative regulator of mitotic exit [Serendipita sp. 405]